MIETVNCPYCGAEQEICHDDGYGYEEDVLHQQECSEFIATWLEIRKIFSVGVLND